MMPFAETARVVRHQNEMITPDNLANDLHWGGVHIKSSELHPCTQLPVLSPRLSPSLLISHRGWDLCKTQDVMFSTQEDMQ